MKFKKLIAAILSGCLMLTAMPGIAVTAAGYRVSVHDPSIVKANGTYYVFGSHIEAAKSNDLQNWRRFSNGYATTNNVEFGNLSQNLKKAFDWAGENLEDCEGSFAVWAPDVVWVRTLCISVPRRHICALLLHMRLQKTLRGHTPLWIPLYTRDSRTMTVTPRAALRMSTVNTLPLILMNLFHRAR